MPTPVVMPQMGESIAEGTIVRWIKKVGDRVERDEPLFEISTDKVDAEIPAPAAGVLTEIRVQEGETVAVDSVVATIGGSGDLPVEPAAVAGPATPGPSPSAPRSSVAADSEAGGAESRLSPLVRRLAQEHGVDVSQLQGTGRGGRVTKQDVLAWVAARREAGAAPPVEAAGVEVEPMSVMRRQIAERMVASRRTSAHVHTVFQVDFSVVDALRRARKADYEAQGARLTYMAFIVKAVAAALGKFRVVNASIDGERILYRSEVNVGIAVALEGGLIVPVIRHADREDMPGLCRAIVDLATRARNKRLVPDDVQDGTFTITNPGQFGAQFGMPIINQPQVAILAVGAVEKRPVVVDDAVTVRPMAYLALGFDHRLIDGATADQFMSEIKHRIEHFDASVL